MHFPCAPSKYCHPNIRDEGKAETCDLPRAMLCYSLGTDNLAYARCRIYYTWGSHTSNTPSRGIPIAQLCSLTPTCAEATELRLVFAAIVGGFKKQEVMAVLENGCSTLFNIQVIHFYRRINAADSTSRLGKRLKNIALRLLGKDSFEFCQHRQITQTAQRSELWPKLNEYDVARLAPWGELSAPENQYGPIPGESELVRMEDIPPGLRPRRSLDCL